MQVLWRCENERGAKGEEERAFRIEKAGNGIQFGGENKILCQWRMGSGLDRLVGSNRIGSGRVGSNRIGSDRVGSGRVGSDPGYMPLFKYSIEFLF